MSSAKVLRRCETQALFLNNNKKNRSGGDEQEVVAADFSTVVRDMQPYTTHYHLHIDEIISIQFFF